MATAKQIIDKALSYVGTYDGGNNNVVFNTDYYGKAVSGGAYPWCCAFVWDIFRMCNASNLFCDGTKTAYCPTVLNWGKSKGLTVGNASGAYGDIVLFDWNSDGVADHIGIIIGKNSDGTYTTVEGNTSDSNYSNGGYVLKRIRYQSQIIGIIRPKYGTSVTSNTNNYNVYYQVYTDNSGWLPVVKNLEDYAGEDGESIKGLRVFADGCEVECRVHHMKNGEIDKVTLLGSGKTIRYRVRTKGRKAYLDFMENGKDTGGSADNYAGESGKAIDRIQISVKE